MLNGILKATNGKIVRLHMWTAQDFKSLLGYFSTLYAKGLTTRYISVSLTVEKLTKNVFVYNLWKGHILIAKEFDSHVHLYYMALLHFEYTIRIVLSFKHII